MRVPLITLKPFCVAAETVISKSLSVTCPFGSITSYLPAGFIASRTENPYPLSGKVNAIPGSNIYQEIYIQIRTPCWSWIICNRCPVIYSGQCSGIICTLLNILFYTYVRIVISGDKRQSLHIVNGGGGVFNTTT